MSKDKARIQVDPEVVKKFNEEQSDWTALCPRCNTSLTGTLRELRDHTCPSTK